MFGPERMTDKAVADDQQAKGGKAERSWRGRLADWLREDRPDDRGSAPGKRSAPKATEPERPTQERWTETRIAVAQLLFGDGMVTPGGDAALRALIDPAGIEPDQTIVEIGAGLGGLARFVAARSGARVQAFDEDIELAEAGMRLSVAAGMKRQAPVERSLLDDIPVRPGRAARIVAKEVFFTIRHKVLLFRKLAKVLTPGGGLSFTDYLFCGTDPYSPEIAIWYAHEPKPVYPIAPRELESQLNKAGFEIRETEDVTEAYRAAIVAAFAAVAGKLMDAGEMGRIYSEWLISEGDLWTRRDAILESGEIRVKRDHAQLSAIGGSNSPVEYGPVFR